MRKRKATVAFTRLRDPRSGRFVTAPQRGRRKLILETVDAPSGRTLATARRNIKGIPRSYFPPSKSPNLVFAGSNRGKRFEDVIAENKLDRKLTKAASKGKRIVRVHIITTLPTGEKIEATRDIMLASKGKKKTAQNRMILLKTLIHTLDGKGIKLYAKKFRKGAAKRTPTGDFRKTEIRIFNY